MMKKFSALLFAMLACLTINAANEFDNPDTIVVSRDGTGRFRTVNEAVEACRAFMTYHKVIFIKKGLYKEKVVIPSWLTNIELCGEDMNETIITYDDHANIQIPKIGAPTDAAGAPQYQGMGTFRTYTLKVQGADITIKNLTIENNAAKLGQAVALHTEGDRLQFINCRFLGNQDTVYTGVAATRCYFKDCYIEGTVDFIFGPSVAWFENCDIVAKSNGYLTAASTPQGQKWGYIFNNCRLKAVKEGIRYYLGRPWREYAHTLFMNCMIDSNVRAEGWKEWSNKDNLTTTRYEVYNCTGDGSATTAYPAWTKVLTKKEAKSVTLENVMGDWKL